MLAPSRGDEALRLCQAHADHIELMAADGVMPRLRGREMAQQLVVLRPGPLRFYMAGYADDAIVHHGMPQPGAAFLQKSFTPEPLTEKVRQARDQPHGMQGVTLGAASMEQR